jgi:peptidoglycan/xylan/chitin deacetylase (PgdA/CDA1 family)
MIAKISTPVRRTVISLLLHDVTDTPSASGFRQPTAARYKHSIAQFGDYLDVIDQSGLVVADNPATMDYADCVVLTFDDGGASAIDTADLLEARGWRGFFFVTTDLIDAQGFLSRRQIAEIRHRGHLIGSHSCRHPDVFRNLTQTEMQQEWSRSRDVLEQLLGESVTVASVPGGDIDRATIREASAAGLDRVFTSEQRTQPWSQSEATCYGRLMMLNTTSPETLRRWLTYPGVGILPERALRFTKSGIKKVMGPFYHQLVARRRAYHEQT